MPAWERQDADYKVHVPNQPEDTRVLAALINDKLNIEPSKIVLENHSQNQGISVLETPAREHIIMTIAKGMKRDPQEAEWFAIDESDGKLRSLSLWYEKVTNTDPSYTNLRNSGDLNWENAEEAKKYFPSIQINELRTKINDVTPEQQRAVSKAFAEAKRERDLEPDR